MNWSNWPNHIPWLGIVQFQNKSNTGLDSARHLLLALQEAKAGNLRNISLVPDRAYIEGALAVYELNRVELLRDVFLWAYERSCQRYLAIRQSVGEPDAFRLKYRTALHQTVAAIVRGKLRGSDEEIIDFVREQVRESDWEAFVDAIQSDLNYLYEGNIARYQLRFSEYQAWAFKRASG
jgi:hypothetical protein